MKTARRSRGFSLIEALVALVVMAFGMLGVLGIQATLRLYSDISKQRSEAVRIAQDAIEDWRAYTQLVGGGGTGYTGIVSDVGAITVTGALASSTNTTYQLQRTVAPMPNSADMPQLGRWVGVDVRWNDRTGAQQTVSFFTHVAGVSPELAGTLVVPPAGGPTRRPLGRHGGIPRQAVDQGDGTSVFAPPGLTTTTWVFNNTSGAITRVCNPTCADFLGYLLSGLVRFTDPLTGLLPRQPTGADAENPVDASTTFGTIGVIVQQTVPSTTTVTCATEAFPTYVTYYCAMQVTDSVTKWSGRSLLTGLTLAADAADVAATKSRVCRYTPLPSHLAANVDHPLDYANVTATLFNQNFLVMRAGDGTSAFSCPGDDTSTPEINGNTYAHQPSA